MWSSCVDPLELVMRLNQDSLARSLTHATSTPEVPSTYIHSFPSPDSPKKYSTPIPGENSQKHLCFSPVK